MINTLYNDDCLNVIGIMEENLIDLTCTSVPYNVNLGDNKHNKNKYSQYDDNKEHIDYLNWLQTIFSAIYAKTKTGGRCVINIGSGKNGRIPTQVDIVNFMRDIGWLVYTDIIWNKNQVGNRTSWGSWLSPSSPQFPHPYEHILVFCKDDYKLQHKGETDLTKEEFIEWAYGIWKFAPETKMNKLYNHPAMFPEALPLRCIKMFTYIGDLVFDPFSGIGTTSIVAKKLNRNYIGAEISQQYHESALLRLSELNEKQKQQTLF